MAKVRRVQPLDKAVQRAETRTRIANRLKELMQRYDLSVRALSRQSGLARNTVIAALKGQNSTPATLGKLFDALESPPQVLEDLLKPRLSKEDLEVALAYHEATTDIRNVVAKILKTREFKGLDLEGALQLTSDILNCTAKEQRVLRLLIDSYRKWPEEEEPRPAFIDEGNPNR